ncbi:hypothetical protein ACFVY9_24735 [Streptomyces sp. NPDC059544]|uniref:hypothetical protein n=1 Tax=Streptomyces sp. NPDC059544 TaxID=3346861 RepID=UPI0036A1AA64
MHGSQAQHGSPTGQLPARQRAVGPGWHPLLTRLHEQLTALDPAYRVNDVQEKFGTLRIQLPNGPAAHRHDAQELLTAAQEESAATCEFCGAPGHPRRRGESPTGWIKTVCDSCHTAWSRHNIMIINGVVHTRDRSPA